MRAGIGVGISAVVPRPRRFDGAQTRNNSREHAEVRLKAARHAVVQLRCRIGAAQSATGRKHRPCFPSFITAEANASTPLMSPSSAATPVWRRRPRRSVPYPDTAYETEPMIYDETPPRTVERVLQQRFLLGWACRTEVHSITADTVSRGAQ